MLTHRLQLESLLMGQEARHRTVKGWKLLSAEHRSCVVLGSLTRGLVHAREALYHRAKLQTFEYLKVLFSLTCVARDALTPEPLT